MGINAEKSGTFADIPNRESGIRSNTFPTIPKWCNRGGNDYAIMGRVLHHMSCRLHQM